ncbi:MAG: cytochrome b [Rhodobacteraceae bacterium]|nr:cytochrome b [Paracoccaceae bacterium]
MATRSTSGLLPKSKDVNKAVLWRNSPDSFGLTSKLLHWVTAALVFGLIGLGLYLANTKVRLDQLHLYGWHKATGLLAFSLILLRVAWRIISPPPEVIGTAGWQSVVAHWVHRLLFVCTIAMPITGWVASSATGFEMSFFGLFSIPLITPVSERLEDVFFALHGIIGRLLILLIILHVAGALQRQFVKRDGTLKRMWF